MCSTQWSTSSLYVFTPLYVITCLLRAYMALLRLSLYTSRRDFPYNYISTQVETFSVWLKLGLPTSPYKPELESYREKSQPEWRFIGKVASGVIENDLELYGESRSEAIGTK